MIKQVVKMKKIGGNFHANPILPAWEYIPDGEPESFKIEFIFMAHMTEPLKATFAT